MLRPVDNAFVRWDNDMGAPGGSEPSFEQVFEAGWGYSLLRVKAKVEEMRDLELQGFELGHYAAGILGELLSWLESEAGE